MRGLNKVMLIGHLGKDPEMQYLEGNIALAKFSLATSESFKDKAGNWTDKTEWHNIIMWRGLAETAEKYLKKGSLVYIEGKIQNRSWDDKDGNKRYITEIRADRMNMLDKKPTDSGSDLSSTSSTESSIESSSEVIEDDLPF